MRTITYFGEEKHEAPETLQNILLNSLPKDINKGVAATEESNVTWSMAAAKFLFK
jgi:hypothetical protein